MQQPKIQRVAVIGAGLSGVVSAAHLLRAGLDVTVFERNKEAGGIWIHSSETAIEPPYPCMRPADAEKQGPYDKRTGSERRRLVHAPPGPCYDNLRNNIVTPLMQVTLRAWPQGTPRVVDHPTIRRYIQEMAASTGVDVVTCYGAAVSLVRKLGAQWHVRWSYLGGTDKISTFDAVVVASGHYHAPRIPDIPGLAAAKSRYPDRVTHSKYFRNAEAYKNKNVLLIGGAVSSTDIAKDISPSAHAIWQSTRNSKSDMSAKMLPANATRVSEIAAIDMAERKSASPSAAPPGHEPTPFTVRLQSGPTLAPIDHIIICTGYQYTLPFLPHLTSTTTSTSTDTNTDTDPATVLITDDGAQIHNLHRDIFYIPDPTLAFVGLPLYTTVFTLFEFQAVAVAAFFRGLAPPLPPLAARRIEYEARVAAARAAHRPLHSLREEGAEEAYVDGLLAWVNDGRARHGLAPLQGHTDVWRREMRCIRECIARLRDGTAVVKAEGGAD